MWQLVPLHEASVPNRHSWHTHGTDNVTMPGFSALMFTCIDARVSLSIYAAGFDARTAMSTEEATTVPVFASQTGGKSYTLGSGHVNYPPKVDAIHHCNAACMYMIQNGCEVSAWACCLGAQVAENRSVVASPPNAFGRGGWRWYFGPMTAATAWICGQPDSADRCGRISALTTGYCNQPEQSSDLLVFSSSPAFKPFLRTPAFVPRENNHFREQSSSHTAHSRSTAQQSSLQLRLQSASSKYCHPLPSPSSHASRLGSTLPRALLHLGLANIINSMITGESASSLLHSSIIISSLAGKSIQDVLLQSVHPHHNLHPILHIASLSCGIPSQLSHLPSYSPS